MKKVVFLLAIATVAVLLSPVSATAKPNQSYTVGRVLVHFKAGTKAADARDTLKRHGARQLSEISQLGVKSVDVPAGREKAVAAALAKDPRVEYAEPSYKAKAFFAPNDPYYATQQWGLENTGQTILWSQGLADADIDASAAWEKSRGNGVKIAVVDSGIDARHPELAAKMVGQVNFSPSQLPNDLLGHGTHVAGIAAATVNNGKGVAGGCPDCKLLSAKVLSEDGTGSYESVAMGIVWAADNGAKVINLSLGGPDNSHALRKAVDYAWQKGAVIVAAAGNNASDEKMYPAAYPNVIAVAATNNLDERAFFSNYSANWVDVAAPGEGIFSTLPSYPSYIDPNPAGTGYGFLSGTSMASPLTAAVAGLLWDSPYGTSNVSVRNQLQRTADKIPGTGTEWSSGRVNAARALGVTTP